MRVVAENDDSGIEKMAQENRSLLKRTRHLYLEERGVGFQYARAGEILRCAGSRLGGAGDFNLAPNDWNG